MVSAGPLHLALTVYCTAPEISSSYYYSHLDSDIYTFFYRFTHISDNGEVQSARIFSRKRFPA